MVTARPAEPERQEPPRPTPSEQAGPETAPPPGRRTRRRVIIAAALLMVVALAAFATWRLFFAAPA